MTISKWVNLVFAGVAILAFVVFDKTLKLIWATWNKELIDYALLGSYVTLTTALAVGASIIFTFYLYRRPGTFGYLSECVSELQKVTWPSLDETKRSTVVVIVFTILLSTYLAMFDWVWKVVTDFIITPGA